MKRVLTLAAVVLACTSCHTSRQPAGPQHTKRPNIVLFLVDDLGWQDIGVPLHSERTKFNDRYHTPHVETLARGGLVFTNAYAAAPVCTPTRVSIMTGQAPARHRVTNWTLRRDRDTTARHPQVRPPRWNVNGLQPRGSGIPRSVQATTLAQSLQANGYRTIHAGKAHWGTIGTPGADPRKLGFDVNIAGHAAGAPGSYYGIDDFTTAKRQRRARGRAGAGAGARTPWDVPGLEKYHGKDIYLTDALTIEANRAVAQAVADEKPFFLHLSHYAVHTPIMKDRFLVGHYVDELAPQEAAYASMIEGVDASLGAVMQQLEDLGVADNTIVVFFSDNGGLSAHSRAGPRHTHNAPLRSGKGSAYEGGVRVPMIVRWPGVTGGQGTQRCDAPVIAQDLYPTLLAMAGVEIPAAEAPRIDGVDLRPLIAGERKHMFDERILAWHYPNKWGGNGPGVWPYSAIRHGPWKLIYIHGERRLELYDLATDIGEQNDLVAARPKKAAELATELEIWLTDRKAQMSVDVNTGKPVPMPSQRPR